MGKSEIEIPRRVAENCGATAPGAAWLRVLPEWVGELEARWALQLGPPIAEDASCAWVARARRRDGSAVVLKLGFPHMEARDEIVGLEFWAGDGVVRVLARDLQRNAMLLECCDPGTPLKRLDEFEQDIVIAGLLRRLWRVPPADHSFRALRSMIETWAAESEARLSSWPDAGLAREGLSVYQELAASDSDNVLLATDLHAGNVLRAEREPWLVIDPKPFVGDRCYDATQHLLNCLERLAAQPVATISRFADLLEVDTDRVWRWTFARLAASGSDLATTQTIAAQLRRPH